MGLGSLVGWDEVAAAAGGDGWHAWKEDPVAAATETALNIGMFAIPYVGFIGGVGKVFAGGAKASRAGRGGKHLKARAGDSGTVIPGGKSISAENTRVFADGSKVSQNRTDAVEDIDLTPDHGPETREAGSGTGGADSSAGQSRQGASDTKGEGRGSSGTAVSGTSRTDTSDHGEGGSVATARADSATDEAPSSREGTDAARSEGGSDSSVDGTEDLSGRAESATASDAAEGTASAKPGDGDQAEVAGAEVPPKRPGDGTRTSVWNPGSYDAEARVSTAGEN